MSVPGGVEKMLIKAGVDISRLKRNARRGLQKVDDVFRASKFELIITSTYEGNHDAGSLHYADEAFDIRKSDVSRYAIYHGIKEALGDDFDVVSESNHWHIEYDPKQVL